MPIYRKLIEHELAPTTAKLPRPRVSLRSLCGLGRTDGFRSVSLCDRLRHLTGEVFGERPDRRIVEYRSGVDRERATELGDQPVAEFDRHQ